MSIHTIMGLFAKSPIKPLQRHIVCINECCSLLVPFFEASAQKDWDTAGKISLRIAQLEKEADVLKREIRLKLPRGLFLPVDRRDLLELLTQQDKLANLAKDVSGHMFSRQLSVPEPLQESFIAYVKRCLDAANQAQKVINELDELLETGFKGREVTLVAEMINQLDVIEDDTDNMHLLLRQQLMALESDMNPVNVMFLYKIFEWMAAMADQSQRVGSRLELMLSRT